MPKFTFTCEHKDAFIKDANISKIVYESNREYLGDVLEDIRDFLRGCGYSINGDIDVIEEDVEDSIAININLNGS